MKKIAYIFLAVVFLSVIGLPSAHADLFVSSSDGNIYRYRCIGETCGFDTDPVITGLDDPRRMVIAPDGDLYVVNYGDNRILRYNYDEITGTYSTSPDGSIGTLIPSESLALGPNPESPVSLYVLDELDNGMGAVYKCELNYVGPISGCGNPFASGTELIGFPADMVFGTDGNLYVTNPEKNKIVRINSAGEIVTFTSSAGTNVSAIDFGNNINSDEYPELYVYRNPNLSKEGEPSERVDIQDGDTGSKLGVFINDIRVGDFVIHMGILYATLLNNGNIEGYDGTEAPPDLLGTIPHPAIYESKGLAFDNCGLDTDGDGDGFSVCDGDCDDSDDTVYPGATELCDGKNNDCDGVTADGSGEAWYGQSCDGPDSDLCDEGTYECGASAQSCSDVSGDDVELCDGFERRH